MSFLSLVPEDKRAAAGPCWRQARQQLAAAVEPSGEGPYVDAVRELIEQLTPAAIDGGVAPVLPLRRPAR